MKKMYSFMLTGGFAGCLILMTPSCSNNPSPNGSDSASARDTMGKIGDSSTNLTSLKPSTPKPDWAPDIRNEEWVVLEKLQSYGDKPIETLSAPQARLNHTPADAVRDVMKEHDIPMPIPAVDTIGKEIPVAGGTIHARIYTPKNGNKPFPVVVYYHGGGWIIADINTYDASAAALAEGANAIVVSVHYRQGPEHKFPTAHNDAFAAYKWVLQNAASWQGDPKKVAVAGESAGGNLACNVAIMARDKGIQVPLGSVLVYPVANSDMNSTSYVKYANAKPLSKPMVAWMVKNYLVDTAQAADPRISLVKANLKGLKPITIIGAEIDPLESDGEALRDALKSAGVQTDYKRYDGVTHEFFGMGAIVPDAKDAENYAVAALRSLFK